MGFCQDKKHLPVEGLFETEEERAEHVLLLDYPCSLNQREYRAHSLDHRLILANTINPNTFYYASARPKTMFVSLSQFQKKFLKKQ